ncbi:coiled-coil domain-containing protein 174 [Lucilia cuprina]|uniref:coiled-coil domain-containing protein 174 n=1 Tax=Lucilia cuprina TaxID=7375 RepID=UPI001F06973C|nr:coiled-coil domain-containing protein 174 [Lucilia cuprina]
MNDPNKVINVNLSSLLSLKAELLRKQAEVNKAKVAQTATSSSKKQEEYTSHKQKNELANDYDDNTSSKKNDKKKRVKEIENHKEATVYEHEDSVLLEKSQKVLEAKAKFYERMQKSGGKLNSDDNCLVMFNKKKQEDATQKVSTSLDTPYSCSDDSSDSDHDTDDEWVEYTDCLGRTRTCLKRDLAEAKRKDEQLAASMPERLDQTKANWMIDTVGNKSLQVEKEDNDDDDMIGPLPPPSVFNDGLSTMSKLEEQKVNWERKEQENLEKTDVHYQDVFFDEARQHGVGYYAFSTDEEERKKQQKELEKARQQTLEEQKRREALKEQREKIIAERVLAAKNRQRARLGLPPLEKVEVNEKKENSEDKPAETKEERKARKKAEKLERKKLKEEEERERERQNHIRPWDKEKEGVALQNANNTQETEEDWQYKPEKEPMTQEQWNEYKRNERINEFAPPPTATNTTQDKPLKRTNFKSSSSNLYPNTNYNNVPPPEIDSGFSKYQSSKKSKTFKRRSYAETTQTLEEDSPSTSKTGVCIPPPSNLEDFPLPSHNKKPKTSYELEKSIEAGLRFLRNNCDKEMPATKSSWTAKADY